MRDFKVVIITIIAIYIILTTCLVIKSSSTLYKELNKPFAIEEDPVFEKAIGEDKEKISKYKKLAKTNEEKICLNSTEELINHVYDLHHPKNVSTFKEYNIYIFGNGVNYDDNKKYLLSYTVDVLNNCGFNSDKTKTEIKKEFINEVMKNVVYYEENFRYKFTKVFSFSFDYYDPIIETISSSSLNNVKKRHRLTPELLNNDNSIKMLDVLLKEVGEKYEN